MARMSRRAYVGSIVAGGGVATAGCFDPEPSVGAHELLVLSRGDTDGRNGHGGTVLTSVQYSEDDEEYRIAGQYTTDDGNRRITSFDATDGGYAVTTSEWDENGPVGESSLAILDSEMAIRESVGDNDVQTVTADDEYVYAASDRRFAVFDANLDVVGSATLQEAFLGKHMEDILVHDGVAYVVDDEIHPRYLLRVDVTEPSSPAYIEVVSVSGANHTLGQQWIDPDANRWMVLQWSVTRMGASQNVVVTPMEGAETGDGGYPVEDVDIDLRADGELRTVSIYEDDGYEPEGTYVADVTSRPPTYGSVTVGDAHYLSSIDVEYGDDVDGDRITFGTEVEIESPARVVSLSDAVVAMSGDDSEATMRVYEPGQQAVVLEETLEIPQPLELRAVTS